MKLTFEEKDHIYRLDGEIVPSVTQVLGPVSQYAGIPKHILDRAAVRGNYVHTMCEYFLWGNLDESTVVPEYMPYLDAFKAFLKESKFQVEFIEERVYHAKLRYAGCLDLGGTLPGRRGRVNRAMIDIKTTFKLLHSVGPQTAGYNGAWESTNDKDLHFDTRWGLQLKKDGTFNLLPLKSTNHNNVFRSCLAIFNYMKDKQYA